MNVCVCVRYPSPGFVQVFCKDVVCLSVLLHFGPGDVVDHLEVQAHTAAVLTPGTRQQHTVITIPGTRRLDGS